MWVTLDRRLTCPRGLRFSMDGSTLCVADCSTYRVWMIRVDDGRLVKMCASGMWAPYDVEEVQGGWLVACCSSRTVEFISDQGVEANGHWLFLAVDWPQLHMCFTTRRPLLWCPGWVYWCVTSITPWMVTSMCLRRRTW